MNLNYFKPMIGDIFCSMLKDLILALGGVKKPILNAKYYFHRRKMILREKHSLKPKARIVSCTKSNNSLTNALVKHEEEHMPDILKNERNNLKL
jgi:hypothetical protein